jgi:hypothetical protein
VRVRGLNAQGERHVMRGLVAFLVAECRTDTAETDDTKTA